ncbi:DUF308 domain-containing protein [Candidatus Saccharibacteria bacterium]|nr:DUF308 domain-containing protein [Candidatus Saccharibacteria bacterium]
MAHINRRYIDKHWLVFAIRGTLAGLFGFSALFGLFPNLELVISVIAVFLLGMGIIDSISALYASARKHGWVNSVIDALIDIATALCLLFFARFDIVGSLLIIAIYTFVSGLIDIFHGFLSTVDPTDRFIRVLAGILGCVMGFVILNAGIFEEMTFIRFFGAYMLVVGVTSLIYGVHNRAQNIEDHIARSESAHKKSSTKSTKSTKKSPAKSAKTTKRKK